MPSRKGYAPLFIMSNPGWRRANYCHGRCGITADNRWYVGIKALCCCPRITAQMALTRVALDSAAGKVYTEGAASNHFWPKMAFCWLRQKSSQAAVHYG